MLTSIDIDDDSRIYVGDCLEVLPTLEAGSVHMVCTSPPYWGLRNYGVDGQFGAEKTAERYIKTMVKVFREVRRVLHDTGVLFLNLGDTYAKGQLLGIPWRVALALQEDGWILRQDIIWHKPSVMPESVRNRCSKAHEYIFLLSKQSGYYYDVEAIKEKASTPPHAPGNNKLDASRNDRAEMQKVWGADGTKNKRSVWTIASEALYDEHFAAFPTELAKTCIAAGSSRKGCCPKCLAPWAEQFERDRKPTRPGKKSKVVSVKNQQRAEQKLHSSKTTLDSVVGNRDPERHVTTVKSLGWKPTCECGLEKTIPCTILDIFSGSGTSGLVALRLHRRYIGIELNPKYAQNSLKRIRTNGKAGLDAKDSKQRNLFNGMD